MNIFRKKSDRLHKTYEILDSISRDRVRTNLLRKHEQMALSYLVKHIPRFISSDMLTAIGFSGNIIVFLSFILATYINRDYLLISILGFTISWFGDSLDGRLAYYRNIPRKKYGFTLDITIDWMSIILIGCGYMIYSDGLWKLLGYGFVVLYGWEMIIALMRYKITGVYSIDSGKIGPTEVRIVICLMLVAEVLFKGTLIYSAAVICVLLFLVNIRDTTKLLRIANEIDIKERGDKTI